MAARPAAAPAAARPPPASRDRKLAVLGSRNVGKSSLVVRYVEGVFVDSYYPTVEGTFAKDIRFHNQVYPCQIIDTAGQDEFSLLYSGHAEGIHGFLIVFALNSRASFDIAPAIAAKISERLGIASLPAVLVGQKSDLHQQRVVSREEGKRMARDLDMPYIETSARHGTNVDQVFQLLLEQSEKHLQPPPAPSAPSKKDQDGCMVM